MDRFSGTILPRSYNRQPRCRLVTQHNGGILLLRLSKWMSTLWKLHKLHRPSASDSYMGAFPEKVIFHLVLKVPTSLISYFVFGNSNQIQIILLTILLDRHSLYLKTMQFSFLIVSLLVGYGSIVSVGDICEYGGVRKFSPECSNVLSVVNQRSATSS